MGDMADSYRKKREREKRLRAEHGVPCPRCREQRPKAQPTILIPGQQCFDGYRDPRPKLREEP